MKGIWEQRWFMIPVGVFFGAGIALALIIPYGNEILYFNDWRQEPYISIFKFFSWCGETWIWVVAGLAALFWRYRFTLMIAITGLITPFVYVLKDQVGSDRPITYFLNQGIKDAVVTIPEFYLNTGQTSFPSGHTMAAFGLFSLLCLMAGPQRKKLALLLALLAIAVGISRVFLVQHFLVDVLAGAFLGMAVSGFVWWVNGLPYFQGKAWMDGRLGVKPRRS